LEIASCWKNDRYILFPDGEASSAVLWEIELTQAAAADQLESVALDLTAALGGQTESAKLGKTLSTPEGRHLTITRTSPTRIRFINAALPSTAAQFSTP
jgi:hypothetical protein